MLERAYVRFRENIPDNANTYAAAEGFALQGVPVVPFYGFGDLTLANMPDLGPTSIVCGNLGDVWTALKEVGRPMPEAVDYPPCLEGFLGRRIERMSLGQARGLIERRHLKPVQQKLFGGFVFDPEDPRSRLAVAPYPDDTPCFVSEEVDFVSEYRCFFRHGAPVGVQHYRGDSFVALDKPTYNRMVKACKGMMPDAYALDMGVTADGRTLLVEATDAFAVGSYGLNSLAYARVLEARWVQIMGG